MRGRHSHSCRPYFARRSRKRVNRQDIDDLAQPVHTVDYKEGKYEEADS